jgi:hypothetical protein
MRGKHNISAGAALAAYSLLLAVSSTTPLHAGHLSAFGNSVSGGPRPLYLISPTNGNIIATLITPFRPPGYGNDLAPLGLGYGGGYLWALGYSADNSALPLYKIDPANGAVARALASPFYPPGFGNTVADLINLASGGGYLWALGYPVNNGPRPLYKCNPTNGALVQTLSSPFRPPGYGNDVANKGMAYGAGSLWAFGLPVNNGLRPLYRFSPTNGTLLQTITTAFQPLGFGTDVDALGLAYGADHLWALGYSVNNGPRPLYKINPSDGSIVQTLITPFRPPGYGTDVAALGLTFNDVAQVTLNTNPPAGGTLSGGGSVDVGSELTVSAAAAVGYGFVAWTEGTNTVSTNQQYTFPVSANRVLTANFSPKNSPPTDINLSNASVAENQPIDTLVGTLSTADSDPTSTFTYTLVSGTGSADNSSFSILGNTLRTTASFNYEARTQYSVRIRTTDQGGLSLEKRFTIQVTDLPEPPLQVTAFVSALNGSFTLRWTSEAGYTYQVAYSETLAPDDWHNTGPSQIANNGENSMSFTDIPVSGAPRRFYRIVRTSL